LGEQVKIEIFDLPELLIWLMLKMVLVKLEMAEKFKIRNEVCRWIALYRKVDGSGKWPIRP